MAARPGWLRGVLNVATETETDEHSVIGANPRNIVDRANDIKQAQRVLLQCHAATAAAENALDAACKAFEAHCGPDGLDLPLEISQQNWPRAKYDFHD